MAKWATTPVFDRRHRKLTRAQKAEFVVAIRLLNATIDEHRFRFPKGGPLDLHTYAGFRRPPAVWSMDFGRDGDHRALFTVVDGDTVLWHFIGTHQQIVRWQDDVGPTGLRR
jgi:hypothetical protein